MWVVVFFLLFVLLYTTEKTYQKKPATTKPHFIQYEILCNIKKLNYSSKTLSLCLVFFSSFKTFSVTGDPKQRFTGPIDRSGMKKTQQFLLMIFFLFFSFFLNQYLKKKSETKLTADILKEDQNTQKVENERPF